MNLQLVSSEQLAKACGETHRRASCFSQRSVLLCSASENWCDNDFQQCFRGFEVCNQRLARQLRLPSCSVANLTTTEAIRNGPPQETTTTERIFFGPTQKISGEVLSLCFVILSAGSPPLRTGVEGPLPQPKPCSHIQQIAAKLQTHRKPTS